MLPYRDSKITKIVLLIFFVLVVAYAYFEAQGLLFGPSISVPSNISEVHDPFITITGRANRIASLSMNGKSIDVTESGNFSEPYVLNEGDNRIVLDAKDKYGRSSRQVINVVYTPDAEDRDALDASSSTSSASTPPASGPVAH